MLDDGVKPEIELQLGNEAILVVDVALDNDVVLSIDNGLKIEARVDEADLLIEEDVNDETKPKPEVEEALCDGTEVGME